ARLPGPGLGEHTAALLREAGFDDERIAALLDAGAVAGLAGPTEGSFLS
ncbi:MAG: hypothetical protein JWP17_3233, partial [Solirubrobacterales bacterium]|nr:hypothetical protein [Solirubrobacterales bacterium]